MRRAPALLAGLLWLAAAGTTVVLEPHVAFARRHALESPLDAGVGWFRPALDLVAMALLVAGAHGLSVVAHGGRGNAPRAVRTARVVPWVAMAALFAFVLWLQAHPRTCVAGCGSLLG